MNYLFTEGLRPIVPGGTPRRGFRQPFGGSRPPIGPSDVADGLSQTAFASERLLEFETIRGPGLTRDQVNGFAAVDPRRAMRHTGHPGPLLTDAATAAACRDASGEFFPIEGPFMVRWSSPFQYNHVMPPNSVGCYGIAPNLRNRGAIPPTSEHAGGCNVLRGDGSVSFTSNGIDDVPWMAAATISGGEIEGSQW